MANTPRRSTRTRKSKVAKTTTIVAGKVQQETKAKAKAKTTKSTKTTKTPTKKAKTANATLKTQPTKVSPSKFFSSLAKQQKSDCEWLSTTMEKVTGKKGAMWGESIVGFGDHHIVYDSGRELDWFVIGFAPRKAGLALYINNCGHSKDGGGPWDHLKEELQAIGKHKKGKGCLNIRNLDDIDKDALKVLIEKAAVKPN
eukprot:m.205104 g.205104  ORF g.205104 m.205104 type:complete len:199 (+) comp15782_c0_seq7:183-779(+)